MVVGMSRVGITVCARIGTLLKITVRHTAARNKLALLTTDFIATSLKKSNWAKLIVPPQKIKAIV
jgi:hypothetical protein